MLKIINFFKSHYSFFIPTVIFLLSIILIAPWGSYPVNDDWQFFTHVRYFSEGNFKKNPLIDASFILQGYIGLKWIELFGLSFTSLRVLTIITTILFFLGFYKVLKKFKLQPKIILLAFFCLLIEPFILTSALSFMTEIYFLTFMIWSLYFFLKFHDEELPFFKTQFLIIAVLIGSLSILIRQFGIVLLLGYLISILYSYKLNKSSLKYLLITILFFSSTIYYNLTFPQYAGVFDSKEEKMLQLFADYKDLGEKLSYYPKYLVYFAFIMAPFLISLKVNFKKIYLFLLSVPLAVLIFSIDIFDLKNVFHIECYYCESNFYHEYSLFDNVPFKYGLSFFLAYLLIKSVIFLYEIKVFKNFKKGKLESKSFTVSILALGMFGIILAVDSFYDRYFLNFNVLIIILIGIGVQKIITPNIKSYLTFVVFYLIILFLNLEFHNSMFYKWNQAMDIYNKTEQRIKSQIFVAGTFSRYMNALEKEPKDLVRPVKFGVQKCYVLRHIKKDNNFIIQLFNQKIFNNRFINNPTFSNKNNINEIPKTTDNLNHTIQVNEYFSPMFNLLGQKTYIISFCNEEVRNRFNLKTNDATYLK